MSALASMATSIHGEKYDRPEWGARAQSKSEKLAEKFKIEDGIPIPRARKSNGASVRGFSGVLRKLKKTQSVVLPVSHNQGSAMAARVIGSGCYAIRNAAKGVRIWRTR